jgi:hypothetical protein
VSLFHYAPAFLLLVIVVADGHGSPIPICGATSAVVRPFSSKGTLFCATRIPTPLLANYTETMNG